MKNQHSKTNTRLKPFIKSQSINKIMIKSYGCCELFPTLKLIISGENPNFEEYFRNSILTIFKFQGQILSIDNYIVQSTLIT